MRSKPNFCPDLYGSFAFVLLLIQEVVGAARRFKYLAGRRSLSAVAVAVDGCGCRCGPGQEAEGIDSGCIRILFGFCVQASPLRLLRLQGRMRF